MNISRISSSRIPLIVTFVGCIFFSALLFLNFSLKKSVLNDAVPLVTNTAFDEGDDVNSPLPVRLIISKINVDAPIESLGVTPQGNMEAPRGGRNVGWFNLGPHPGDIGTAVIDGHYGRWKNGEGSVFDNLDKLEKGDTLQVEDEKGTLTTFVVRESRTYDPKADTSDIFSSDDEKSHLNLITCEGVWDKGSQSYSKRLVVFTDKE